jgi:protein-S-isoprenylcysteine O-methyltransferase Ste14
MMTTSQVRDFGPGVAFPPTMFFVIALGVGLGLEEWHALPLAPEAWDAVRRTAGFVLFGAGSAGFAWGMWTLFRASTGIMLERPASTLVAAGPYRWSRNPQYVAFVTGFLGIALLVNTAWLVLLLPVVIALLTAIVIRREERYLREEFGEAYSDYCRRVSRWI